MAKGIAVVGTGGARFRPWALLLLLLPVLRAEGPMRYRYNAPESAQDHRYEFHWAVLRQALEHTRAQWGDFAMEAAPPMSERRQTHELMRARGRITVMYLSTSPALEAGLQPVRIPVDRGLSGYFVFLVRCGDQVARRFAGVRTPQDLGRFRIGLGLDWLDGEILKAAGLRVVTGSNYEGLFEMLRAGRFDLFPRSLVEVSGEFEAHRAAMPELCIEESLLLHYPWPMYFWFARNEEGRRLAARAEAGMRALIRDGTYERLFQAHFGARIAALGLGRRRLLELPNPLLPPGTPLGEAGLWFRVPGR